jgi:NitT/TauT family transport system substrate-binding protein
MKTSIKTAVAAALCALAAAPALAQEKLSFITTWRAQAEHGGYYQAVAKGFYKECGLDLTIRQGGPGIDGKQLFVAGAVDILMASFSDSAFQINEAGYPSKAVMAIFQKNPQILMTHEGNGIEKFEDMKGKGVMIGAASRGTFWPFLRAKFGYTDDQIRPYSGQIAPWLVDKTAIQQGLVTNEPFRVQKETGKLPKVFLLAQGGYQAYSSVAIVPQKLIDTKPQLVQCFVDASAKGWADFFKDPAPAVALIRKDNPDNPDDVVAYAIKTLKDAGIVDSDDTRKSGYGAMSDARWRAHAQFLAEAGVVAKDTDYRKVFTTQFVSGKRAGAN